MKTLKLMGLRAAQAGLIAFISAIILNFFFINFPAKREPTLFLDWEWILSTVFFTAWGAMLYVSLTSTEKMKEFLQLNVAFDVLFAIVFGLAFTITSAFNPKVIPNFYPFGLIEMNWIYFAAIGTCMTIAMFTETAGRSFLFALLFASIVGCFISGYGDILFQFVQWFAAFFVFNGAALIGRIIRFVTIFLFFKDHEFTK